MKFSFRAIVASLVLFGLPLPMFAATLFTEPRQIEMKPHQDVEVALFLDTQDEDLNALEGTIVFPTDLLELKEVRDGNSIINFWVERPKLVQGPVTFSGIIPGGYRFPKGLIVTLIFEAKQEGQGMMRLENARVLRNDGQGTQAPLTLSFSSFIVSEGATRQPPPVTGIVDTDLPEPFVPLLSHDPASFDGKWFLSFATQDKGSGLDHFEIRESYAWGQGSWVRGESPYVLRGQDPSRAIQVKAVDRAGHERIAVTLPPRILRPTYEIYAALGILLIAILLFTAQNFTRIRSLFRKK